MIEVLLTKHGQHHSRVETDLDNCMLAARTIWDEALEHLQGEQREMKLYFLVDGETVRTLDKRP